MKIKEIFRKSGELRMSHPFVEKYLMLLNVGGRVEGNMGRGGMCS